MAVRVRVRVRLTLLGLGFASRYWLSLLRHAAGVSVRWAFGRDEVEPWEGRFPAKACSAARLNPNQSRTRHVTHGRSPWAVASS
eukprot:scaffold92180_cov45-Phaeocystis_antarctica.AAC.1